MKTLAIDPATKCGWAIDDNGVLTSGTWTLKDDRNPERSGMRFVRMRRQLEKVHAVNPIDKIVFEDVRRHIGTGAAHCYGGLVAMITAFCEDHNIAYDSIAVGTIKKFATGNGNASKDMMVEAAMKKYPTQNIRDDNQADALFILATFQSKQ